MCAGISARSNASTAATSSPTATRTAKARTRNGSIRCVFDGRELWGADADPTLKVSIDAFEPYLEMACTKVDANGRNGRDDMTSRRAPRDRRSAGHSARRRRAGVPRAVGGAGFRHDAGAARARRVHLAGMGGGAVGRRSSARKAQAIPTPARPITCIGWRRWSGWWRKKASPMRRHCIAITTPGSTPASARRTASRSNCGRTISTKTIPSARSSCSR